MYHQACSFDGINDFVNVNDSNSLDLTHGFTLMAWVKATDPISDWRAILVKNYTYYLYAGSTICSPGGTLAGYFLGSSSVNACWNTALTPGTWTHIAARYGQTQGSIDIFINGVQTTTIGGSDLIPTSTGSLNIGASLYGEFFKGLIDEIRIYNCALGGSSVDTNCAPAGVPQTIVAARDTPINALPPPPPAATTISLGAGTFSFGAGSSIISVK
jgi:hypothetical protein